MSNPITLPWSFHKIDISFHYIQLVGRDVSETPPRIASIFVDSTINTRFVSTTIKKKIVNFAEVSQNVTFRFQLPADAFISDFMMIIDGIRYQAEVKPKEEAQKAFDEAREKGQNAGQVKQSDRVYSTTDEFEININVSPNTASVFHLQFQELLHRDKGVLQHMIYLSPGQVVKNVEANIYIKEPQGFSSVDVTWEQEDGQTPVKQLEQDRPSDEVVHVHFAPSMKEQEMASDLGLIGHFNVVYDVIHDHGPGDIQVRYFIHNGYFVHHISPEGIPVTRKNVIFVIDVSGSMSGNKLTQTKSALNTIIGEVRDFDMFSIIIFNNTIETWEPSLVSATKAKKEKALKYIRSLNASGGRPAIGNISFVFYEERNVCVRDGTNLHGGLVKAVNTFETYGLETPSELSMIIMLTDGVPTVGGMSRDEIVNDTTQRIQNRIALFCLGFGDFVDGIFLERLAVNNQGVYKQIRDNRDASNELTGFFDEVASPLLFNIDIQYTPAAVDPATLTQSSFIGYFQGKELVVSGKLNPSFTGNELLATVMANSLNDRVNWQLSKEVKDDVPVDETSPYVVDDFAERLWAYLTIKDLLLQSRITMSESKREKFREKALSMSLQYRFVTPLTSLVIIEPDNDSVLSFFDQKNDDGLSKSTQYILTAGNNADFVRSSNLITYFCLTLAWTVLRLMYTPGSV
ncbi:Inter-alpha-trypsin inhibitor heavy chain H4 [Holothuria leucospilota]|uniref:Inter-alpha-trypsin inhibitor heavy chain H4 n=1 Tax=Holothuria leucospilota TaxID=206669 RepID=A0A9Q1CJQ4_HOLLE|nr:Inter-alpha-trypsin inhibitor heavy chain H4 [Holothuria leucospilota]